MSNPTEINNKTFIVNQINMINSRLAEIKADREIPAIVGCGWTVAYDDSGQSLIHEQDGGYNFSATWNRDSVFWSKSNAKNVLEAVQNSGLAKARLVHVNTTCDQYETTLKSLLDVYTTAFH